MQVEKPFRDKVWNRANGRVHLIEETPFGWQLVIIRAGRHKFFVRFQTGKDSDVAKKLPSFKIGDRIKCRFYAKSEEYKGKWYTNLFLKDIDVWVVGEERRRRDDAERKRRSQEDFDNSLFGGQQGN